MMRTRYKMLLGVSVVWAIVMTIGAPRLHKAWHLRRAVNQTFTVYKDALTSGRLKDAYGLATPEFRGATSLQEFEKQQQELMARFGSLKEVEQSRTRVDGKGTPPAWNAEIYADLRFENGTVAMVYWFRVLDGQWKLVGYRLIE